MVKAKRRLVPKSAREGSFRARPGTHRGSGQGSGADARPQANILLLLPPWFSGLRVRELRRKTRIGWSRWVSRRALKAAVESGALAPLARRSAAVLVGLTTNACASILPTPCDGSQCATEGLCFAESEEVPNKPFPPNVPYQPPRGTQTITHCIAESDEDCAHSTACKESGRCTAQGRRCVVGGDEDCAQSNACKVDRRCVAQEGDCFIGDEVCAAKPACKEEGACQAIRGQCVVNPKGCAESDACRLWGQCRVAPSSDDRCVPTAHEHCEKSYLCQTLGRCTKVGNECRAWGQDCRGAPICAELGRCTAANGKCAAWNDEDCRPSTLCKRDGHCTALHGECVKGRPR